MSRRVQRWILLIVLLVSGDASLLFAGPFDDVGIPSTSSQIKLWAEEVVEYAPSIGALDNANSMKAVGVADGLTVSLGDLDQPSLTSGQSSGSITVRLPHEVRNGPGWDLVVFENAFELGGDGFLFAELAYVEVSDNGIDFLRFPATSLTQSRLDLGFGSSFSAIHPTNVHNLAGKHPANEGTAFDFADLQSAPEVVSGDVSLRKIQFVRIVDIPGSASFDDPLVGPDGNILFPDQFGSPILDPWDTSPSGTGGFDLDAVGARYPLRRNKEPEYAGLLDTHSVPEPSSPFGLVSAGICFLVWLRRLERRR